MVDIKGASVIVTGSSSGVGRGIARVLARYGARVTCTARRLKRLNDTVRQIEVEGGEAIAVPADIRDKDAVTIMVNKALDTFGGVDVLVNNAATYLAIGGFWEVTLDDWWSDVVTNMLGPFLCCRAVLPHMMKKGRGIIINITGGGAGSPMLGGSAYGSSKAGLMRMTDSLAFELQKEEMDGIHVYGLNPGFVRTGISERVAREKLGQKWLPHVKQWIEVGQHHPGEEVGEAIFALCQISCPALSGRIFSYDHDFSMIARSANDIQNNDSHQLRMR